MPIIQLTFTLCVHDSIPAFPMDISSASHVLKLLYCGHLISEIKDIGEMDYTITYLLAGIWSVRLTLYQIFRGIQQYYTRCTALAGPVIATYCPHVPEQLPL